FQVLPDDRERPAGPAGDEGFPLPAARARFDPWRYGRILEKAVPALAAASVFDALTLFSRLLADAVRLSTRRGDEAKPDDYSSVWRRTIEGQGQKGDREVRDALVSAVRDVAEILVRENRTRLPEVVATLEGHGWYVFQRI